MTRKAGHTAAAPLTAVSGTITIIDSTVKATGGGYAAGIGGGDDGDGGNIKLQGSTVNAWGGVDGAGIGGGEDGNGGHI